MARVLIAEDDLISQTLAMRLVEELGHTAFVSPNGRHAYEALKSANKFDLLITDIMMPVMDGKQLIQTLRGDSEFMDLPIVIMSAVVGINEISELLNLGATLFMSKPINRDELTEMVTRVLNTHPGKLKQ